ncbi:MAG TPA: type II toxin-antitoxin system Phd/YefM family antitoxin [Anaerovibrio sp.]|uniref:type II toxin-antitoxin system Phd/YefM family antitoxin n=1 Tax=Anaerovibrio lipolyticus TaxID=82374 RepID=UPI000E91A6B3|nr:type II toxin-antitoxin system Phd/YefM family antitoxin [Anaerovibrio lipolyticus]MBE6106514.1 type II toxin-antitoxin system Phd/YefM family antitoxin [Anaerovibrio lipolyticus]HAF32317.1 type II toxin-antitoxin system Phd/YefM family antitoxin [Anaerovibrio sp.]HAQ55205.1 type II toxin-antitoxin system Phd/YefM family antitoxin [Anaerovibrio sp.]HCP95992.1 type II toxin-antitoxin system Phd/YefM family antitoxin [Anaerovibrio sp.]
MIAVPSSDFLKEFTIYADKATDEKETIFVQRSNDKNLVVMSMDAYNEIQKKLYEMQK